MTTRRLSSYKAEFAIDWTRYPKLARVFEHRPAVNAYWSDLRQLLRDARADAVRYVRDVRAHELRRARAAGRREARKRSDP